ncbi:MAG TPA: YkgJ family cysteine cluster protein [Desulfosalsimonadaceae bacterium]|nr:YkgJ family cysteine cluster protein [Desulfosalsimonadaceae bacterium]
MKYVETDNPAEIPGRLLEDTDRFCFRCYPGISCFNQCCRNLNLFLYPYDVIRLRKCLGMTSGEFIDAYADVVVREGSHFPSVLLHMAENAEKTCPFLTDAGCRVYPDRPQTCRAFPIEHGIYYDAQTGQSRLVHYFRPPDFCHGQFEETAWTKDTWAADQEAVFYNQMTVEWADFMRLFHTDPWGGEGPNGQKGRMAFMATYNVDTFRDFVLNSSFLKRYKIKSDIRLKIKSDDVALLRLGIAWVKLFLFGIVGKDVKVMR